MNDTAALYYEGLTGKSIEEIVGIARQVSKLDPRVGPTYVLADYLRRTLKELEAAKRSLEDYHGILDDICDDCADIIIARENEEDEDRADE